MSAPKEIVQLIDRFERNEEAYRSGQYNETQLRLEFIDPFFKGLGWDVHNEKGWAEAYKDVIHEDAIKVGGATKAPDYCFRIGGARKFFLEAKKPSVNIKDDLHPAYQLRRYAWSAKLPLSILTDFEEFAAYDCRIKPFKTDRPSTARILYVNYAEYPSHWDEISFVFSRDAVLKGSFDKYAESHRLKKGTAAVDAAFLEEIESWREMLARNLALRNPNLTTRELNFAVQRTIDRVIFLRICEDRRIEPYGRLMAHLNGDRVYERLCELFRRADERYNSGLFHFHHEKDRAEEPDTLTLGLSIDDELLKTILRSLYYPESPYEFSVLPANILGQVYEQFLGKVIRLTAGHRAVVEEKPEVKKAGGVYYTPTYIVDYIVKNTVGKLLEGKTWRQAAKLRVLDPACGSGSFLIGAYQHLLDWHRDQYAADNPEQWTTGRNPRLYQASGGDWKLTTAERKRILLGNIYGVDIDPQAVEVTKLSLLLKVLEGETGQTVEHQLRLFHERALPDLGNNIKCGNSLIGPDFYENQQMSLLPEEDRYRINVFDWQAEFPAVFTAEDATGVVRALGDRTLSGRAAPAIRLPEETQGFDVVIGNPPYIRIQTMQEWAPIEVEHYKGAYVSASKGNYDIYVVFVERGLSLLNDRGRLGFILPHRFFNAQYGEPLRDLLAKGKHLSKVIHFGDQQVFSGPTTYTCLLFLDKKGSAECQVTKVTDLVGWRAGSPSPEGAIPVERITSAEWNFPVGKGAELFEKLRAMPIKLKDVSHIFVGLQTDSDDVFILEEVRREGARVLCTSNSTGQEHWFEDDHLKPFLKGSLNIRRYFLSDVNKRLIFPYEMKDGKSLLIEAKDYRRRFPLTWTYLEQNKPRLTARNKGQTGQEWYGYVYKKNHTRFVQPKLVVPAIATGSCFAADLAGNYYFVGSGGGGGGGYGITLNEEIAFSPLYLLGLLNSSLLSHFLISISTPFRSGYLALNRQYIEQLPIRPINFSEAADKARHDRMVKLVEQMLSLHKQLAAAKFPHEQTALQRQIEATDRQVDLLVYELYGLSDAEIQIVEESNAARKDSNMT